MALTVVFLLFVLFAAPYLSEWQLSSAGDETVAKVERYKSETGHYPANLKTISVASEKIFYTRCDQGQSSGDPGYCETGEYYYIWFGTTLGESQTYDSRKHHWD